MIKKLLGMLIFCMAHFSYGKILIWDFGGILFEPNKLGVANEIGLKNFISYMLLDWKNPNIEKRLFKVLEGIESNYDPTKYKDQPGGSAEGTPLPPIMCEWQAGTKTGPEIIKLARKHIKDLYQRGYLTSERERVLLQRTVQTMFNPTVLARNVHPSSEGVKLLQECARIRNRDGSRKHQLIAFSNWDHLSFGEFYKRNKKVFNYFDHIVVSGEIKLIKPHREAFQYLIDKLRLNPRECILIDDQKVNAIGAKACGMKALLINGNDYDALRIKLKKYGILP
jgi:FMN phosphatase YigB (HAD superfamily)